MAGMGAKRPQVGMIDFIMVLSSFQLSSPANGFAELFRVVLLRLIDLDSLAILGDIADPADLDMVQRGVFFFLQDFVSIMRHLASVGRSRPRISRYAVLAIVQVVDTSPGACRVFVVCHDLPLLVE
ncbi:MAG: hypothetical protein JWM91_4820 [Rhodospirillales bacterium]|nr:hypothetical protein [Rhodospirillales bacterium]